MPREVWKFPLPHPWSEIAMPEGARVLSAGTQGDDIVVWAECDSHPHAPQESRRFISINTGAELPTVVAFVDTVSMGPIVWHVYEVAH